MQAKIDTLRVKDNSGDEYLLYPRTLTQSVIDEDGKSLADTLDALENRIGSGGTGGTGGSITISSEADNAIESKPDGIYVADNSAEIEQIQNHLAPITKYQKYVNTELDSCFCTLTSDYAPVAGEYVPFVKTSGTFEVENGRVIVKPGQRVQINVFLSYYKLVDSHLGNIPYYIKDYTNDIIIEEFYPVYRYQDGYEYSDSHACQYTNDTSVNCEIGLYVLEVYHPGTVNKRFTGLTVQEIGRAITIDPAEYVNKTQGIEDAPVGNIINYAGTTAPDHYLLCDGTEYNISDYPYLAQHFIDQYGLANHFGGDGTTTFTVPNYSKEIEYISLGMTDYTTPQPYAATASSFYDTGYEPWHAFDNDQSALWCSLKSDDIPWIKLDLGNPHLLLALRITSTIEQSVALQFTIEGSNDDSEYILLKNYETDSWSSGTTRDIEIDADKQGLYRYVRITVTKSRYGYGAFTEILIGTLRSLPCIKYEPTYFMKNTYLGDEKVVLWEGSHSIDCSTDGYADLTNSVITLLDDISNYNTINIVFNAGGRMAVHTFYPDMVGIGTSPYISFHINDGFVFTAYATFIDNKTMEFKRRYVANKSFTGGTTLTIKKVIGYKTGSII